MVFPRAEAVLVVDVTGRKGEAGIGSIEGIFWIGGVGHGAMGREGWQGTTG